LSTDKSVKKSFWSICLPTNPSKKIFDSFVCRQILQKKFLEHLSANKSVKKNFWPICRLTNPSKKVFGEFVCRQIHQKNGYWSVVGQQVHLEIGWAIYPFGEWPK